MKSIKLNLQGIRFLDVLLAALSIIFHNYFGSKGYQIPNDMTVVLPARIEAEGDVKIFHHYKKQIILLRFMLYVCLSQGAHSKLQNRFSIGPRTIPISSQLYADKVEHFYAKLLEIKKTFGFQVNY